MNKRTTSMITGLAVGTAVGAATAMIAGNTMKINRKAIKRNANKALRSVGQIIDNVATVIK